MTTEVTVPQSYAEAIAIIASAKARGGRVWCGMECGREATVVLVCENGTIQGVGCDECWEKHRTMMEMAKVWHESYGDAVRPMCSRCGDDNPSAQHISAEAL